MKTARCVRCPRANGAPLLGSRLMGKDSGGRWRLRTGKPPYRGGPDPNAVIRFRDRLAAHGEALAPEAPMVRFFQSALSADPCAVEVQLSSRPGPPPFQSAPSRHSERLQAEALGGVGGVARPRGLNAA